MKKIIAVLIGGIPLLSNVIWAQCTISGMTSPTCINGPIQNLTTTGTSLVGSGISGNNFDPSVAGVGSHIINAYDFSQYTVNQTGTFSPIPSVGTPVSLGDDQVSGILPVGFSFNFFGNVYTNFLISSNGFISFDPAVSQGCCSGGLIPSNDAVNNVIAWSWNDLYPPGGGTISYETVGVSPNRKLLVTFTNQWHFASPPVNTAQIILYETTNIIEIHSTIITNDGSVCTQGIENSTGTVAYSPAGRNSAIWTTTNDYVAFIPVQCASTTIVVEPTTTGTDSVAICTGGSYVFGTQTLTVGGTYTEIFATAGAGCDSTVTLTLTENPVLTGTDAITICAGDTVTFGSQTLTSSGMYVEVFSSTTTGCDSSVTLYLTVSPTVATTDAASICTGDTYLFGTQTLTVGGTYTEIFSSSATGCDSTVTLTLTENTPPTITVVSVTNEITGNDGAIDINVAGGSTYSYSWSNSAATQDITGLVAGTYTVVVTDDVTGCFSVQIITVGSLVGIVELVEDMFQVYPNPSSGFFYVKVKKVDGKMELMLVNSFGQQVFDKQITEATTKVDISGIASGIYFIRVISEKEVSTQSIVIE